MESLAAALQFLTRLPLSRGQNGAKDRARAGWWFGLVGLGIGAILALAEHALRPALPLAPRLVCVLILNALLTGGLHLDGLADTADSLGSLDRSRALAIMRDSRIGAYGVLALVGILALQFTTLAALPQNVLGRALLLAPAWGRAAMVMAAAISQPARADGLGAAFVREAGTGAALACLATAALATALWGGRGGIAAGVAAVALAAGTSLAWQRRLGGQTGDTLGCLNQLAETATYVVFLVMA